MIYINIDNHEPDEDWLNRADILTASLLAAADADARMQIIEGNENMWGELKQHFCNVLHRKWWYSESVNDFSHFHLIGETIAILPRLAILEKETISTLMLTKQ